MALFSGGQEVKNFSMVPKRHEAKIHQIIPLSSYRFQPPLLHPFCLQGVRSRKYFFSSWNPFHKGPWTLKPNLKHSPYPTPAASEVNTTAGRPNLLCSPQTVIERLHPALAAKGRSNLPVAHNNFPSQRATLDVIKVSTATGQSELARTPKYLQHLLLYW